MKRVIYRIHYGFQFIYDSIKSVHDWADEILVVVSKEPWYKGESITYLGREVKIEHPEIIEYHIDNLSYIPKVKVEIQEFNTPANQWGILVNKYSSDYVLTMEPDMVFKDDILNNIDDFPQIIFNNQLEFWKNEYWRIPQRKRPGPVLYKNPQNVKTGFSNNSGNVRSVPISHTTLNYGFCLNPELMLYKHLLALGFSKQIGDSVPNETWYRDKWLNWTPSTKNIEISKGHEHNISGAIPI